MKLSEAIRLNGMMKPQGKGNDSIVSRVAPCALGGALQSIGRQPEDMREAYRILVEEWPWISHVTLCPCGHPHIRCTHPWMTVAAVIWTLNDLHGWSRSAIADWVQQFESSLSMAEGRAYEEPVVPLVRR